MVAFPIRLSSHYTEQFQMLATWGHPCPVIKIHLGGRKRPVKKHTDGSGRGRRPDNQRTSGLGKPKPQVTQPEEQRTRALGFRVSRSVATAFCLPSSACARSEDKAFQFIGNNAVVTLMVAISHLRTPTNQLPFHRQDLGRGWWLFQ